MNKRSEIRKLEAKKREWDEALLQFKEWWGKWWPRAWREFRICKKMIFDWYFFYKGKDRAEHIILWILVNLALLRIFRFI